MEKLNNTQSAPSSQLGFKIGIGLSLASLIGCGTAYYFKKLDKKVALIGSASSVGLAIGLKLAEGLPQPMQPIENIATQLETLRKEILKQLPDEFQSPSEGNEILVGFHLAHPKKKNFVQDIAKIQTLESIIKELEALVSYDTPRTSRVGESKISCIISCKNEKNQWLSFYGEKDLCLDVLKIEKVVGDYQACNNDLALADKMDAWFKQYKTLTALFPEKTYSSLEEGQPAALLMAVQKHDGQIVSEQAILTTTFEGSDEELRVYPGTSKKEQISSWLAEKREQDIVSCFRKGKCS